MKIGMFVTASFQAQKQESHIVVPASAIAHLHDQDFVYVSKGNSTFALTRVVGGAMLPGNLQVVLLGLQPGQMVATNALELQSTVTQ